MLRYGRLVLFADAVLRIHRPAPGRHCCSPQQSGGHPKASACHRDAMCGVSARPASAPGIRRRIAKGTLHHVRTRALTNGRQVARTRYRKRARAFSPSAACTRAPESRRADSRRNGAWPSVARKNKSRNSPRRRPHRDRRANEPAVADPAGRHGPACRSGRRLSGRRRRRPAATPTPQRAVTRRSCAGRTRPRSR
jgi:hypothetical protein